MKKDVTFLHFLSVFMSSNCGNQLSVVTALAKTLKRTFNKIKPNLWLLKTIRARKKVTTLLHETLLKSEA
jgi:hypothetical protein